MAVNLPPVVRTSKRTIPGTRVFDAANVFADYNTEARQAGYNSHYRTTFNCTLENARSYNVHRAGKINKPDPTHVHFLYDNTRFTNEPICNAATKATRQVQHEWWPDKLPNENKPKPSYSCDSSSRSDFGPIEFTKRPRGLTRFGCIEGKRSAALGIVPVTQLPASHCKTERISYKHQFDARRDMRERGKLHGSFVWDTTNKNKQKLQRHFVKRKCFLEEIESAREPPPARRSSDRRIKFENTVETTERSNNGYKLPKALTPQLKEDQQTQEVQDGFNKLKLPSSKVHETKSPHSGHINSPPPHLC